MARTTRTPFTGYNATAISYENNQPVSVEAVEVQNGRVVRGCGHWSAANGTDEYQSVWLSGKYSFVTRIVVVKGTKVYQSAMTMTGGVRKTLEGSKLETLLTFNHVH